MTSRLATGDATLRAFRFGVLNVVLANSIERLEASLALVVQPYEELTADAPIDLVVEMSPTIDVKGLHRGFHWDFGDGWAGRFGHFFVQRWYLTEGVTRVVCNIARSPLALARPLVDYEMHTATQDIGKFLHESILVPSILLLKPQEAVVFHGATLGAPNKDAVLITGQGGVGKTSLALELRKRADWSFLSDDLVVVDAQGVAYLNAAWPKIYAYNASSDVDLENVVLEGRSVLNRIHWRILQRWPERVRRSVPPSRLFGGLSDSARLRQMLLVERDESLSISWRRLPSEHAAQISAETLALETARFGSHVLKHTSYRRANGLSDLDVTWDPDVWRHVMGRALADVDVFRITVPRDLAASDYRQQMMSVLTEIESSS